MGTSARDKDAYKEVLYSSLEEYERMAQMVGDMLYLAQADNGQPVLRMLALRFSAHGCRAGDASL